MQDQLKEIRAKIEDLPPEGVSSLVALLTNDPMDIAYSEFAEDLHDAAHHIDTKVNLILKGSEYTDEYRRACLTLLGMGAAARILRRATREMTPDELDAFTKDSGPKAVAAARAYRILFDAIHEIWAMGGDGDVR